VLESRDVFTATLSGVPTIAVNPANQNGAAGSTPNSSSPFIVDDSADSGNAVYTITASTVQINDDAPISYAGSQSLLVKGGSGTDVFNVEATAAATPVTLAPGSGSNTVNVTPTSRDLGNLGSFLTVQGGAGTTLLNVDDQADPSAGNLYTVTRSSIGSLFAVPIVFSGIQGVTLNGEGSPASFNVISSGPGTPVILNAGSGNATFTVGGRDNTFDPIQGPVTVNGGNTDTLTLLDQGETAGQSYTLSPTSLARPGVGPINFFDPLHAAVLDAGSGNDTLTVTEPTALPVNPGGGSGIIPTIAFVPTQRPSPSTAAPAPTRSSGPPRPTPGSSPAPTAASSPTASSSAAPSSATSSSAAPSPSTPPRT
jgi:hypothetical protein